MDTDALSQAPARALVIWALYAIWRLHMGELIRMIAESMASTVAWSSGSYSMFSLSIEIDDTSYAASDQPTLWHEYTHYIQNVTTIKGFTNIDDFIRLFLYIFATLGSASSDEDFPLCTSKLPQKLGQHTIENKAKKASWGFRIQGEDYACEESNQDDYSFEYEMAHDPYHGKNWKLYYVCVDGKKVPLNEVTIRENMAMVNTLIACRANLRSEESIDAILSLPNKEYNTIFDFVQHYLPDKNCFELVYRICEFALALIPSEETIYQILNDISANSDKYCAMTEKQIISTISRKLSYDEKTQAISKAVQAVFDTHVKLMDGIIVRDNNDFVRFVMELYKKIKAGLDLRSKKGSFYTDLLDKRYLNEIYKEIGGPIVYLKQSKEVRQIAKEEYDLLKPFVFIHAALTLFYVAYSGYPTECPFLKYKGMCDLPKTVTCSDDCTKIFMSSGYEGCLLNSALKSTGIRSVNRYLRTKELSLIDENGA